MRKGAARVHACAQAAALRERTSGGRLVPAVQGSTRDLAAGCCRVACLRPVLAQAEEGAALDRAPFPSGEGRRSTRLKLSRAKGWSHLEGLWEMQTPEQHP